MDAFTNAQHGNGAPAPSTASLQAWLASHDVQFYESEAFLHGTVADFLMEGVRLGQPIVVIATLAHMRAYMDAMRARGVDPRELTEGRDAIWLEARETLAAFMEGSRPNRELFDATVGNVFGRLRKNRRYVMVRAHGEMVDLLWRDGKAEAALQLEEMWNDLAKRHSFTLLCTYSKATLENAVAVQGFEQICAHHSRVLPSEASARVD